MEEYSSRRSTTIGFLRRSSGISSRNQSHEERRNDNSNGPGITTRLNPLKVRSADNQERPRCLRDSFKSSSSKVMPTSSSKVPLRKFGEEKRRHTLLAGVDIAGSRGKKAEAKHLEGSKKIVEEDESSGTLQTDPEGLTTGEDQLVAHDPEFSHSTGSSDISAHTESLVRSAAQISRTHRQKDKELNLGRAGTYSSSFTNQPAPPRNSTIGAKPSYGLASGVQRRGLKNLRCTSVSDVLTSGCSSDSVHNCRFEAMRKRASDGECSSRSRGLNGPSSLCHSPPTYPGIAGPRITTAAHSVSQQTIRSGGRNIQDSAVSVRTRRPSPQDTRLRMSEEREDGVLALHDSATGNQRSDLVQFSLEEVPSDSSIRPFFVELPHAIYSSSHQGSNSRTARRRSSPLFEESPPEMLHGLLGERDGHRCITTEGIVEVLLALDRIEQEAELTYEQLLVLETNLFLSAFASHDQHRDMRMDIDNMSYEELLALEERIGFVSTALSEEQFRKCLRRTVYRPLAAEINRSIADDIKCSICQEEYMEGDEVGRLGCEHQYHVCCIHQWLRQKNWCPICKASAVHSST